MVLVASCVDSEPAPERDTPGGDAAGDGSGPDAARSADDRPAAPAWQWIEVAGSICRNGSVAGFHVSRSDTSKGILLYLEGGGSCYDPQTCALNPDSTWQLPPVDGLFDR